MGCELRIEFLHTVRFPITFPAQNPCLAVETNWSLLPRLRRERRTGLMWNLHEMLVQDEILFCGLVLLTGIVAGAAARWLAGRWERKVAR
jgi:hypothetical protein